MVVLRYYEDLSEAQTADRLGVSIGTVKSAVSRALVKLRDDPELALLHGGALPGPREEPYDTAATTAVAHTAAHTAAHAVAQTAAEAGDEATDVATDEAGGEPTVAPAAA
jgi:hypothetical protein